jgi:hypothetical protein
MPLASVIDSVFEGILSKPASLAASTDPPTTFPITVARVYQQTQLLRLNLQKKFFGDSDAAGIVRCVNS